MTITLPIVSQMPFGGLGFYDQAGSGGSPCGAARSQMPFGGLGFYDPSDLAGKIADNMSQMPFGGMGFYDLPNRGRGCSS